MIFCFSGTGNSRLVAERLAVRLSDRVTAIEPETPSRFQLGSDERVVWVFPVYSWGIPSAVRQFMRGVSLPGNSGRHSLVCTCGDDCGLLYNQWLSEMHRRGWHTGAAFSVEMPNTYVALPGFDVDSLSLAEHKLSLMPACVDEIARAIRHDARVVDMVRGRFAWIKTRIIYPFFMRFLTSPRRFRVSPAACIGCGRCVRSCPMLNVWLDAGKHPRWDDRCTACLACYHSCPYHAIDYGPFTRGKGQYLAPDSVK